MLIFSEPSLESVLALPEQLPKPLLTLPEPLPKPMLTLTEPLPKLMLTLTEPLPKPMLTLPEPLSEPMLTLTEPLAMLTLSEPNRCWHYLSHYPIMTSSNGNIFRVAGPLWGNPPVSDGLSQRPVMRSYDVFFDLRLNKRLNEQSRRR